MHDLPHCITTPMHQYIFIFICMFMVFKQIQTLIDIKEIKQTKKKKGKETETQGQIK